MQNTRGPEFPELARTVSRSRSTSLSSDSQLPRLHLLSPPPVNPPPLFIASSSAAQIITADQEFNTADFVTGDEENGAHASALVTPEALSALNGFLDHLLFNILATAKSTQLTCIRPAIAEVLKPRLANEVVSAADDELSEYMGGEGDEQFEFRGGQSPSTDFDLNRSWKLTRLRCMVYTRLGDMEEDDEDEYIAQDGLAETDDGIPPRFTTHVGNITPAAAIFLTSIIEHIGEQALIIAGETARSRLSLKLSDGHDEVTESGAERSSLDHLVVEELDMEKLALNPTLGRLWRTWRRRVRSRSLSRTISGESIPRRRLTVASASSRKSSIVTVDETQPQPPVSTVLEAREELDPASIALPMSEYDVDEIEIPGFVPDLDGSDLHDIQEAQTMQAVVAHKVRPHSLMVLTLAPPRSPSSTGNSPVTPASAQNTRVTRHVRSRSLPSTPYPPEDIPRVEPVAEEELPSEERKHLETMHEQVEEDDGQAKLRGLGLQKLRTLPQAEELEAEGSPDEKTGSSASPEAVTTPSLSVVSVDAVTSQTSSTDPSSDSLSDQQDTDSETIGECELCEKPKLAPLQERMPHRDPTLDTPASPTNEHGPEATAGDEPQLQTQEKSSATSHPAVSPNADAPRLSDADSSGVEAAPPRTADSSVKTNPSRLSPAPDSPAKKVAEPVLAPGESDCPDRPRARPVPSPLPLASTGHQPFGRTSPGVYTPGSSTPERAAVQRLSRPSTSIASSTYSKSRRSDSFGSHREKRPLTAGSTTSQVSSKIKGLIGRQTDSAVSPLRSSSDTGRVSAATGDSVSDNRSGLDELIQSEETIHYTLTPKSVRDMDELDSPRWQPQQSGTADLADFFKKTAPPGSEAPRPRTSKSSSRDTTTTDLPLSPTLKSPDKPKYIPIQVTRAIPEPNVKSPTRSNGSRLEARPAVTRRGDQTAELIKFLREGPPNSGAHQVQHTAAPSQEAITSIDLRRGSPSIASTWEGSVATQSMTSVGSRTGLLDSANRSAAQTYAAAKETTMSSGRTPADAPPARQQRRVRDPYAIDDSDDDEFSKELSGSSKPERQEESLIDFLRNVPPPEFEPRPLAMNVPPTKSSSTGFGSASAMKARLLRKTSFDKSAPGKSSRSSLRQQPSGSLTGQSNYSVKVGVERSGGTVHVRHGLPTVSEKQTETSALANFLRNTGPPEPAVRSPPLPESKKDSSSFSRLFVRRKKVEA